MLIEGSVVLQRKRSGSWTDLDLIKLVVFWSIFAPKLSPKCLRHPCSKTLSGTNETYAKQDINNRVVKL